MCKNLVYILCVLVIIIILVTASKYKDKYNIWNENETFPIIAGRSSAYLAHDLLGSRSNRIKIADNQSVTGIEYKTYWLPNQNETITSDVVSDMIGECKKYGCNAIVYNKNLKTFKILKSTNFDLSTTDVNSMIIYDF